MKNMALLVGSMIAALSLAGCGSDSKNSSANAGGFDGLWDGTENIDWGDGTVEEDVQYHLVEDLMVTTYDYMGDEFDAGDNCYVVTIDTLSPISGDTYRVYGSDDDIDYVEVDLARSGQNLRVEIVGLSNPEIWASLVDEGGLVSTWKPASVSVSDLTPICNDAQTSAVMFGEKIISPIR